MPENNYDIIILGGGPGGYVAAIRAAQLGAKILLIEKEKVGGICLNYGCIPTKAILACTNFYDKILKSENFGISIKDVSFDFNKIIQRKNKIIEKLVKGIEFLLDKNKVQLIYGVGKVLAPNKIEIETSSGEKILVECKKLILATGSTPKELPGIKIDGQKFLSSNDILDLSYVPQQLDIVGGGVIGIHFAMIYGTIGSKVTIYEAAPEILPGTDSEIIAYLRRILARKNIDIKTGTKFYPSLSCGKTLICVGRTPNIKEFESLELKTDKGSIWTNEYMETSIKNIYAVGDISSHKMFAHVAYEQGVIAAENAMGGKKTFNYDCFPYTIYTSPEIGSIGITEEEAKTKLKNSKSNKFSFGALGISQAAGEIEGFIKIISDENNIILGVHIIGPEASTLIGIATIALKNKLKIDDLAYTFQSHPSYPEGLQEAFLLSIGKGIHSIN